jgi:hypothetical protein
MKMNKDYMLWNLKEANEQLNKIVKQLETNNDYDYGECIVDMQHLYHHLNRAWNAKESTKEEPDECSETNFEKWRQFPDDIYMGI